jgi:hypothetical protein
MFDELAGWLESSERGLNLLLGLGLLTFPEKDVTSECASSGEIVMDVNEVEI